VSARRAHKRQTDPNYAAELSAKNKARKQRAYAEGRIKKPSREKQRLYYRRNALKKKYGITLEEFRDMLAAQGHRCAICATPAPRGKGWHVDHCHDTGTVRGVLCSLCNVGIGCLGEDPIRFRAAIAYLLKRR
jgi:hypothetical protein